LKGKKINTSGGYRHDWSLLGFVEFKKIKKLHATESGLFLSSGIAIWVPLELMSVTFVTFLKVYWLLGHLLFHKLLSLDTCTVSGSLVGVSRWLSNDGFGALGSAPQARKYMGSYLPLVHVLLEGFDFASWC
jgi:hypothetical protein